MPGLRAPRARVFQGCEVTSVTVEEGSVTGVATTMGTISSPLVILAAGVWSVELAAAAGSTSR